MKKIVVLGGGTGLSTLLNGLKEYPLEITAIVSVADNGRSTGKLRKDFNIPAVGDVRQVLISLSNIDNNFKQLLNYRFKTDCYLKGDPIGNLILTGLIEMNGSITESINILKNVLNIKHNIYPLTNDNVTLIAELEDKNIITGQHEIATSVGKIKKIYYDKKPKIDKKIINSILESDLIILSMGSLYTSIIPNILVKEIINAIDKSSAKIMYVCNMVTQVGETDNFKASDHVKTLNKYLGVKKVSSIILNNGKIDKKIINNYEYLENKIPVLNDYEELKKLKLDIIEDKLILIKNNLIRHDSIKLGLLIFSYLIK